MSLRRFADAGVWARQRDVYERLGQKAWGDGLVPWRVTTCPLAAELDAGLVAAFARDARSSGWLREGEALTVWDVGAGTGRLGFHLAPALERLGVPSSLVLLDVARSNVTAWLEQPQLAPRIAAGALSVACYDASGESPPVDARTGEALLPQGPLVVLAHYLFDSLAHAAWRVRGGRLLEGWCDDEAATWAWREAEPPAAFAPVLSGCHDVTRLLPEGAFEALRRWHALASGRLLVLAVDKGAEQWGPDEAPRLARHGSVSVGVDFQALGAAWASLGRGARALSPMDPSPLVGLHAFVSEPSPELEVEFQREAASNPLLRVYGRWLPGVLEGSGSAGGVAGAAGGSPSERLRELVVASAFDPDVLAQLAPALRAEVPTMAVGERVDWLALVARCADRHFVFRQALDVPFELGALAHALGGLALAERLYALALGESGPRPRTLYFLACAAKDLGHDAEAGAALLELLEVDPAHEGGRALRARFGLAP